LENPLAQEILAGRFGPGDLIEVGCQDGTLTFEHVIEAELVDS
jgi:ATP-dependent Clp protease ATP-binding subunit ClpB